MCYMPAVVPLLGQAAPNAAGKGVRRGHVGRLGKSCQAGERLKSLPRC
jgi:hypothetical protein